MRISDWSSDVCSSDLTIPYAPTTNRHGRFGGASFGEDVTGAGMVSAFIGGMVIGRRTGGWACWRFSCVCGGFWVCLPGTTTQPGGAAWVVLWSWLREQDLNLRTSGYEPDERSEERSVGKECVRTSRYRWWADHE